MNTVLASLIRRGRYHPTLFGGTTNHNWLRAQTRVQNPFNRHKKSVKVDV
jgi:hypothetical protein